MSETAPAAQRRRLGPSTSLLRFVLRRLGAFVLLMLGITLVAFLLTEIVPSNAAATNLGEQAAADPEAVKAFEEHYGLDKPLPIRYVIYLKHLVHGDLGESSLTHQPVTSLHRSAGSQLRAIRRTRKTEGGLSLPRHRCLR